jgi:hypothetical protein
MNRIILILLGLLLINPSGLRAEIYKYTNHEGVVTLTDTLSKVPLEYRRAVEVLGTSDLAPLTVDTFPASTVESLSRLPQRVQRWFGKTSDRKILISSALAFLLLILLWKRVGGFFFKCAFLLSGVVLLGAALYIFVIPREVYLNQSSPELLDARISRGISTIQQAKELKKDILETENARKNTFQSIFQKNK